MHCTHQVAVLIVLGKRPPVRVPAKLNSAAWELVKHEVLPRYWFTEREVIQVLPNAPQAAWSTEPLVAIDNAAYRRALATQLPTV